MIYFIRSHNKYVKIGTSINIDQRFRELQGANPNRLHVQAVLEGSYKTEKGLHALFSKYRIRNTEWFKYSNELKWFIRAIQENSDDNNIKSLFRKSQEMRLLEKAKRLKRNGNEKLHERIKKIRDA